MPDILSVCLQDILYSWKSKLREQIKEAGRVIKNIMYVSTYKQWYPATAYYTMYRCRYFFEKKDVRRRLKGE